MQYFGPGSGSSCLPISSENQNLLTVNSTFEDRSVTNWYVTENGTQTLRYLTMAFINVTGLIFFMILTHGALVRFALVNDKQENCSNP